jgi:hypothetical protein
MIEAAFTLHNFILSHEGSEDCGDGNDVDHDMVNDDVGEQNGESETNGNTTRTAAMRNIAKLKRDGIAAHL